MKKKILSIVTVFCILASMVVFVPAYALEKNGDFEYQVTDNKVIIRGYSNTGSGVVEVPATIAGMPVVEIGQQAFYNNKNITSVTVPEGVANIGHSAFCKSVNLTTVNLPETLKTIGENAFKDCTNLLNIKIPENVETIGESAFDDCESITSIVIPDSVKSVGGNLFYNCKNLLTVEISKNLTVLSKNMMGGCEKLVGVTIPEGVLTIDEGAFRNCTNLIKVDIPESVTTIGPYAFYGTGFINIEIPDSVVQIGNNAFYLCRKLVSIKLPKNLVNIENCMFVSCESLTDIKIPDGVTSIGKLAFNNCKKLVNVEIPDSVISIGEDAFSSATNLFSITIPDGVVSMGDKAFYNCDNLNSIVIPKSLSTIGKEAFDKSNNLKTVYYKGSEADWNNVVIGEDNAPLAKATIIFNYTGEEESASTPSSWAEEGVNAAKAIGIIIKSVMENYQANITREQFCEMVVKAYEYISGKTADAGDVKFSDTDNDQIKKAANLGIVSGYGDGIFAPNDLVTREQIAAMLVRMISKAVDNIDVNAYNDNAFSDKADISDWALASINFAYDNGIMQGVGENRIDSKSNTTCEQAVLLVYRTVQKYSK